MGIGAKGVLGHALIFSSRAAGVSILQQKTACRCMSYTILRAGGGRGRQQRVQPVPELLVSEVLSGRLCFGGRGAGGGHEAGPDHAPCCTPGHAHGSAVQPQRLVGTAYHQLGSVWFLSEGRTSTQAPFHAKPYQTYTRAHAPYAHTHTHTTHTQRHLRVRRRPATPCLLPCLAPLPRIVLDTALPVVSLDEAKEACAVLIRLHTAGVAAPSRPPLAETTGRQPTATLSRQDLWEPTNRPLLAKAWLLVGHRVNKAHHA